MRAAVGIAALLCLVATAGATQSDRLREKSISLLPDNALTDEDYTPRHLAGYFKLNRTYAGEMFYLFFEHRTSDDAPLVLWMTGGPGCSSELAVFYENGPFTINKDLSLKTNPYGWDVASSIIYVDQPVNTGFSYSEDSRDRVYDEHGVASDMIDFLLAFMDAHPEFHGKDFYITGESYGGHYVPAVSSAVQKYNKKHDDSPINLKGLAVGNGLTDPAIQYGAYADFAEKNGLISSTVRDTILQAYPICKFGIDTCNAVDIGLVCQLALVFCQASQFSSVLAVAGNINVYDIRKQCIGPLCYDFSLLDEYLSQPQVREELGVGNRSWTECNMDVNADMQGDWMKNYDNLVSPMLEEGLTVMIYAGVKDLICNWLGNERWLDALPWSNATEFQTAKEEIWVVNGTEAGSVRTASGLSFVKIADAGHMSPMDKPENLLDMITHFINRKPLDTRSGGHKAVVSSTSAEAFSRASLVQPVGAAA